MPLWEDLRWYSDHHQNTGTGKDYCYIHNMFENQRSFLFEIFNIYFQLFFSCSIFHLYSLKKTRLNIVQPVRSISTLCIFIYPGENCTSDIRCPHLQEELGLLVLQEESSFMSLSTRIGRWEQGSRVSVSTICVIENIRCSIVTWYR